MSIKGLLHNRNKIELKGQPVLTPPNISNKNEPSPQPEEKALMGVYKHSITLRNDFGFCKTFKTNHIHS
jgi:hypothetical protein